MSSPGEPLYSVAFRYLSSDAKKAGAELPEVQLHHLSIRQVRSLVESAAALAPSVALGLEPELRITGASGKFVVQLKTGHLSLVSWASNKQGGGVLNPAQIVAVITGEDTAADDRRQFARAPRLLGLLGSMNVGLLVVATVAVNVFTVWFMTRAPRTNVPKFTLLQAGPAERVLTDVAGVYETGGGPGDRRLEIKSDVGVQRIKFGPNRVAAQKQNYTVKAAEAAGRPALVMVTKGQSLITIKDSLSIVLYGDTYQRVAAGPAAASSKTD